MDKRFQYLPDVLVNIILEDHGGIIHREKMVEIKKADRKRRNNKINEKI
jgi:hypothetical protein